MIQDNQNFNNGMNLSQLPNCQQVTVITVQVMPSVLERKANMRIAFNLLVIAAISFAWDPPDTVWTRCFELDNCCSDCYVLNCESDNYLLGGCAAGTLYVHPRATLMEISPNGDVNWVKEYNSTLNAEAGIINTIVEKDDGYILAGLSASPVFMDYFLLEVDLNGEPISCAVSGHPETDWIYNGIKTSDGGYAFCGLLDHQMLLLKYNTDLMLEWEESYGTCSNNNWAHQLVETSDGGFVLVGDLELAQRNDYCMIKVDSSGALVWEKTWSDPSNWGRLEDVHETADCHLVCLARSSSGVHLFKFDSNGDSIWEQTFSSRSARDFEPTSDGGYVITGGSPIGVWLARVNDVGELIWETEIYGGTIGEDAWTLTETDEGGYIVAAINNPQPGWLHWYTLFFGSCLGVGNTSITGDASIQIIGQPEPNPFSETFSFSLSMSMSASVSIEIHDISGRLVCREYYGCLNEGTHRIQMDSASLFPSGWYGISVTANQMHDEVMVLKL